MLDDDLDRIAVAATKHAGGAEQVSAVLAAEPSSGIRAYLCAFEDGAGARSWLVLDTGGEAVTSRTAVRDAVTIAALCEVAEESAAGGDLDELRAQLVALRLTEAPPGIDEAEEAIHELQRTLGAAPRLATPDFLDDVGAATKRLENALGEASESPFVLAMKQASSAVESLTADVEANYKVELA